MMGETEILTLRTFQDIRGRFVLPTLLFLVITLGLSGICQRSAQAEEGGETKISGKVRAADGGVLMGVVAIEEGRLYSKDYRFGGLIDERGRFSVRVPHGGDFGLHIYATGYIYFPIGIKVTPMEDNHFSYSVPPNPAKAEAPVISDVTFNPLDENRGKVLIRLTVIDPDENLSHQVLGVNIKTQESFTFSPPGIVLPGTRNYPNGVYKHLYDTSDRPFDPKEWVFVASDNRCYNSDILRDPFTGEGVLPARPAGSSVGEDLLAVDTEEGEKALSSLAKGKKIFQDNCAICHYLDRTDTKVGPGLKGLFRRTVTPARQVPVTDENIRKQIKGGSERMPPYGHIKDEDISDLIIYLKSL